ncbi:hypothetical protein BGX28_006697 [Mortierella sp. GBA30]|nr:hypothetical protein BGX28_006697 [Mortierella sp. GBA30]
MHARSSLTGASDASPLPHPRHTSPALNRTGHGAQHVSANTIETTARPTRRNQQEDPTKDSGTVSILAASTHAISTTALPPSHGMSSTRSSKGESSSIITTQFNLQEHLERAAQSGRELLERNQVLEEENKKLKELNREARKSALDWCSLAKSYQQDRNFMALRLSELEAKLIKLSRKEMKMSIQHTKSAIININSNTNAKSTDQQKALERSEAALNEDDPTALGTFVSQSITEILDHMAPPDSSREPTLPLLSKGHRPIQNETPTKPSSLLSSSGQKALRSALKRPSEPSSCLCGCQEELRAWRTRCDFAENELTLQELRYEKRSLAMEAVKAQWQRWKEVTLREQYQRRLKAAMSASESRTMSMYTEQQQKQQQHLSNRDSHIAKYASEQRKRTRFGTVESEASQQRRETTLQNTLYNQFGPGVSTAGHSTAGHRSNNSNRHLGSGSGSAAQPHEVLGDSSSEEDNASTLELCGSRSLDLGEVDDEEQDHSTAEYESQPMSLTFPSDLALRRRQHPCGTEDEEDDGDESLDDQTFGGHGHTRNKKSNKFNSVSPTTRASETRNQKRSQYPNRSGQQRQAAVSFNDNTNGKNAGNSLPTDMSTIESDRSSPIFDSTDYLLTNTRASSTGTGEHDNQWIPQAGTARYPKQALSTNDNVTADSRPKGTDQTKSNLPHTPKAAHGDERSKSSPGTITSGETKSSEVTPDQQSRIFVPETPLELQGITPKKNSQHQQENVTTSTSSGAATMSARRTTTEPIVIELPDEDQLEEQDDLDLHDKENMAPERKRGPEALIHLDSDEATHRASYVHQDQDIRQHQQQQPQQQLQQVQQHRHEASDGSEERIYNFTERRKDKRRQMHGHDCECCRRFYELTGPLPLPDGYNAFFTPAPRPGEKEVWEKTPEERMQQRIQEISRHRVQHEAPLTPPGFWDTDFPPTQDRLEWDRIAEERRQRKKARIGYLQKEQEHLQQKASLSSSKRAASPSDDDKQNGS